MYLFGIGGGFVFDDATSLEPLRDLREYPEYFWPMVFGNDSGPLGRPLTVLTFALEQRFFSGDVELTQVVSIGIHAVNALLVFCLLKLVFRLHGLNHAWILAIFGACLWAYAPQKVSSVLYMVQRMTLLAAFFVLLACCSYVYARSFSKGMARISAAVLCVASALVAPFAKENAVLVFPILVCIELFVVPVSQEKSVESAFRRGALLMVVVGTGVYFCYGIIEYLRSDASYAMRSFSYLDRVSSAPLMLLDYVLQFFVPRIGQMGLFHDDFAIASERPTAAFLSAGVILLGLIYLVWSLRSNQRSLLCFGLALFFVGHSIESSFLPLELYFEHRNYLPSVGLVICFCVLLSLVIQKVGVKGRNLAVASGLAYLAILAFSTATLSAWWGSTYLLVQHQVLGHPNSARAHAENALYEAAAGEFERSRTSIDRAFELSRSRAAARTMGVLDRALMVSASACLAGKEVLAPGFEYDELIEPLPIRMVSVKLLRKLYEGQECPQADWAGFSEWMLALAMIYDEKREAMGRSALIDLAQFESARANNTGAYVYASMALQQSVGNGTALLIIAKASITAGDQQALAEARSALLELERSGGLSPVNLQVFQTVVMGEGRDSSVFD